MGRIKWTEEHRKFLDQHYSSLTQPHLLEAFNQNFDVEISRASLSCALYRFQIKSGRTGKYEKGNQPWNKGINPWIDRPDAYKRIKPHLFKKNTLPHNTKQNGFITQRSNGYYYIRIDLNEWELLHHYKWKEFHGQIPQGSVITFKDGDISNCHINNLEVVTKKELFLKATVYSDARIAYQMSRTFQDNKELKDEFQQFPKLLEIQRLQNILNQKIKKI